MSLVGALYEALLALEIAIPAGPSVFHDGTALEFLSVQSISHVCSCIAGMAVVVSRLFIVSQNTLTACQVLSSAIREGPYLPEAVIFLLLLALLIVSFCVSVCHYERD